MEVVEVTEQGDVKQICEQQIYGHIREMKTLKWKESQGLKLNILLLFFKS